MTIKNTYPYGNLTQSLRCGPGVDREQTRLAVEAYLDAQHMRFNNGQPRKIGGYEKIFNGTNDIVRAMYGVAIEDYVRVFLFRNSGVSHIDILANGTVTGETNRTPAGWVTPGVNDPSLVFSVDQYTEDVISPPSVLNYIIFVAPPNASNPNQTTEAPIFIGNATANDPFVPIGQSTSGGIIVSMPFVLKYGNDGILYWSDTLNPLVWPAANRTGTSAQKLLAAKRYSGGILLLTANQPIRAALNPQTGNFESSPIAPRTSLLSASSLVEAHDSQFYWVGVNNFYKYSGVALPLDNDYNRVQFFKNLNQEQRGKVWGMYMGAYQEIWWFTPEGESEECNRVYIYNIEENTWYDSYLDRSSGLEEGLYTSPLMAENKPTIFAPTTQYPIWKHEVGFNTVYNGVEYPLPAYIQTRLFSLFTSNPQVNAQMKVQKIERDMEVTGNLQLNILTYDYPYSDPWVSDNLIYDESKVSYDINVSGRYVSFKFTTNDLNGFFQLGNNMFQYQIGPSNP